MFPLAALAASTTLALVPHQCAPRAVGPGSLAHGDTTGAHCLLAAFRDRCRSATYTLSSYGVDTVSAESFRTLRLAGGRCGVVVVATMRVVPRAPRVTGRRTCLRLRATAGDVVADRCTAAGAVSLTEPA